MKIHALLQRLITNGRIYLAAKTTAYRKGITASVFSSADNSRLGNLLNES